MGKHKNINEMRPGQSSWRFWLLSVGAGILALFLLYVASTGKAEKDVAKVADETLDYLMGSCAMFDRESTSTEAENLFVLREKAQAARDFYTTEELSDPTVLKAYADSQRLSGILVIDESFCPVGQSDNQAYNMWKGILHNETESSVQRYTHKSVLNYTTIEGVLYAYAVIARTDAPGLILCYEQVEKNAETLQNEMIAELLSGNNFMMEALILVTDGKKIISSNEPGNRGLLQKDCPMLQGIRKERYGLLVVKNDSGTWYGKKQIYHDYEIYAFYSAESVFANRITLLASAAFALLLIDAVLYVIRLFFMHKHIARMQEHIQTIEAISSVYSHCMLLHIKTDTWEALKETDFVHSAVGSAKTIRELGASLASNCVMLPYRVEFLNFLEPTTLAGRLQDTPLPVCVFQTPDGRWCNGILVPQQTDKHGNVENVLFLIMDITAEKKREMGYQEELRKAAEKSNKENKEKDLFLRRMSHDIRRPLNELRAVAEEAGNCADDQKKSKKCMGKIMEISDYVTNLIDDLLNLNQLEKGEWTTEIEEFHLLDILQELAGAVEHKLMETGVLLNVTKLAGTHWIVKEDPRYVRRIFEIVVGNAIRYSRRGDTIQIGLCETARENTEVEFTFTCAFSRNGKSIQRYIYEPFSVEDRDEDTNILGTGFGLVFAKNLVEYMGGSMHFVSRIDEGTEFVIQMPFQTRKDKAWYEIADENKRLRSLDGKKVLLVQSNELSMEIMKYMLERQNIQITTAWNGQEALEQFKHSPEVGFDLILMDVRIPVMDGVETARTIRALPREDAGRIAIIAVTSNNTEDERRRCLESGMNDSLDRPVQEERLQEILRAYCK